MNWAARPLWPADHPIFQDPALADWSGGIGEVAPNAAPLQLLRHVPGRRAAAQVCDPEGMFAVVKVFASPRARGNYRRLTALHDHLGDSFPTPLGSDISGHVLLVSWAVGDVYDSLDDADFFGAAYEIGRTLRGLHRAPVQLDRTWTLEDEIRQLKRRIPENLAVLASEIAARSDHLALEPMVAAHRDCHPRQVVVSNGAVRWIDLDDAAMAPAGLDLGNFIAHLRRDNVQGLRSAQATNQAIAAVLDGYGPIDADLHAWEQLSLIRLAGLAASRHGRSDWQRDIVAVIDRTGTTTMVH